jgi:predicted CoA-substrate-specific enzyme activase
VTHWTIGVDVGSTTVKAVVTRDDKRNGSGEIVWRDYRRHETQQAGTVHRFLSKIEHDLGIEEGQARILFTGSGGSALAPLVGGRFVQEVNAVSLAVEKIYPDVQSVVELGGQDAKVLIFQDQPGTGLRKKIASMNDKCAGGTGAVLDKLSAKLNIPADRLSQQRYRDLPIHRVAGKCGVFAESDINGLQKQGVPADELMASLFEAIVLQNLTVLTRGNILLPKVLLLGGPNTFIVGLREAWQAHIPKIWAERNVPFPEHLPIEELIFAPSDGQYFAAIGAIEFGLEQHIEGAVYSGLRHLEHFLEGGHHAARRARGLPPLHGSGSELEAFLRRYTPGGFTPYVPEPGEKVRAYLGVDGGSTSTKAVLLDDRGAVLAKAYRLSQGNPIQDTIDLVGELEDHITSHGASLEVLGAATTGYAKNILQKILKADVALVETVAHANSALHSYRAVDVIIDVGGQDIKLIILKDSRVRDFMLNTQCSAGNGYFLQATAQSFGLDVTEYASTAFQASSMPEFSYGCAVFLQADIVNFQRQGWTREEILAGLANVLPRNIWLYVAKIPNLPALGRRFLLQGGTQRNLAAVKAQLNYIRARFDDADCEPEVFVHEHCGEAGAIGAALEAARLHRETGRSSFIGCQAVREITFQASTNEETRCNFCKNNCIRTFIDFEAAGAAQRTIVASCEKGTVESAQDVKAVIRTIDGVKKNNPNLVDVAAQSVWKPVEVSGVADPVPQRAWTSSARQRRDLILQRENFRIGVPRVFNQYLYAPFFLGYWQSLGIPAANIVWSDYTSDELYRAGAKRGAIDPCFPSKVVIAHVHNLIYKHHKRKPLDAIFLPMFDVLETHLENVLGTNACPTVIASPLSAGAAFRTDVDVFKQHNLLYLHPLLNMVDNALLARQMYDCWAGVLGVSEAENHRAIAEGRKAQTNWLRFVRGRAREVLETLEREGRLGVVMLGRIYQHDPGLNHGIFEEFQKLGYPVFSQSTLPLDDDILDRVFRDGFARDIGDVWKHSYSASTSHKIWAAKFVARHPNLIGVEVSNFKCGHDAPAYQIIQRIFECAGRPYFAFKDLDENKPGGSIRIRVETIDYYLRTHREALISGRRGAVHKPGIVGELAWSAHTD